MPKACLPLVCFFVVAMMLSPSMTKTIRVKRQLFREQLLPHMGGKVPDSAFHTDRLALNQLNARGIYSATGVYLEHRRAKDSANHHPDVKTMKVRAPSDDARYVAPAGRYHYREPPTLDTTYVIREPVTASITPNLFYQPLPRVPHGSLKLARYYHARKYHRQQQKQLDSYAGPQRNDIDDLDDFSLRAKNEYKPYLKKLHEMD